jgi:UDP-N-acetylmuramoyl-tripeptide--D-alanyl-D-alanine ligase
MRNDILAYTAMENFTIQDILKATEGQLLKGHLGTAVETISTDSRTLKAGHVFIALIGERFDGHDFIPQAVNKGARGILVSRDMGKTTVDNVILVKDTLKALGDIARFYRSRFNIHVVGITGSNGKTTTKDMIAAVLSQKFNVLKNEGNLNNTIGLPLTLFNLSGAHEAAVLEMGISIPGEMARLVEIAQPDVAVVTNVGSTHLEFLHSVEVVASEKGILARSAGSGVLNADDPRVAGMRDGLSGRTIFYGLSDADVTAENIRQNEDGTINFTLILETGNIDIHLRSIGRHNVYNALAAASAGMLFNIGLGEIKEALESYKGTYMRLQRIILNGFTVIDDTYNSNPASLRAALELLSETKCEGRRIAVLGDMLELGERSDEFHIEMGKLMPGYSIHVLITVGDKAAEMAEAALKSGFQKVFICENNTEAVHHLRSMLKHGDIVLIKGSRGMKMEEITRGLSS